MTEDDNESIVTVKKDILPELYDPEKPTPSSVQSVISNFDYDDCSSIDGDSAHGQSANCPFFIGTVLKIGSPHSEELCNVKGMDSTNRLDIGSNMTLQVISPNEVNDASHKCVDQITDAIKDDSHYESIKTAQQKRRGKRSQVAQCCVKLFDNSGCDFDRKPFEDWEYTYMKKTKKSTSYIRKM